MALMRATRADTPDSRYAAFATMLPVRRALRFATKIIMMMHIMLRLRAMRQRRCASLARVLRAH